MKHYFQSNQTSSLQTLVESYTNLIAGKTISEIVTINEASFKKLEALGGGRARTATTYKKSA
jgi:hypothetical protein